MTANPWPSDSHLYLNWAVGLCGGMKAKKPKEKPLEKNNN